MKTRKQVELTSAEIEEAILYWLLKRKGIDADSVWFHIHGESEPDDWRAERALVYVLKGATCE